MFQPQVLAAIITSLMALIGIGVNILVSKRYFEKANEINSRKFEEDKHKNLIDHQLNIIGEIKEKTSGLSEILNSIYILKNFLPSHAEYYFNFKEKNDKKNKKWLIDQNEEIHDILNKIRLQGFKTFSNETERHFIEKFCEIQQFNYEALYEIILPQYFHELESGLPSARCQLLARYARNVNKNNNDFIKYCDKCLTSISKNMGNEKNIDMRYLLGRYPLTMNYNIDILDTSLNYDENNEIKIAIEEVKKSEFCSLYKIKYTGEDCPKGYQYMSYIDIERKEKERKEQNKNSLFF